MPNVGTWAKLAAYVVCLGLGLEFSHRVYWWINRRLMQWKARSSLRAFFCTACAAIPLAAVVMITTCFCVCLDGMSLGSLGLDRNPTSIVLFGGGMLIAFVSVSFLFMAGYGVGWFRISRRGMTGKDLPEFCGGASDYLLAAFFEEIAVRGYIFVVLLQTWGPGAAITGSAAIFSVFHLIKRPKMPLIFTINAFLFGIITAQTRLVTGTLWAPIGLHFGWNLAMGPVYGLPCSGRIYDNGLVCCNVEGPEWLTGGLYSPDAGLLGTATLLAASVILAIFTVI